MSPVSKVRRDRDGPQRPQATSAAAREVARRKARREWMLLRVGQVLMAIAVLIALEHAAAHLGAFGKQQPNALVDLLAGWPLAGLLFIVGAVLAGQRR